MNDEIRDQLSAFLDDELPDNETELLVRRLGSDGALRDVAERYLLIGQSLRGEHRVGADVARRISATLNGEETHAPSSPAAAPSRWVRPVAGVAVAATVAVAALFGLRSGGELTPPEAVTADAVPGIVSAPTDFEYTVPADPPSSRPVSAVPARLTNYMISHGERAGTLVRSGMHSRIVTFGSDREGVQSVTGQDDTGSTPERPTDDPTR